MKVRKATNNHQKGKGDEIEFLLKESPILDTWHDHLPGGETVSKILLKREHTEAVLDLIEQHFPREESRRIYSLRQAKP